MLVMAIVSIMLYSGGGVSANTMVTGTVFCDQCRDGTLSLFDYPLQGAKVAVLCGASAGEEATTNFAGAFMARFDGSPNLSGCRARVVEAPERCGVVAYTAAEGHLTRVFDMFGMGLYVVAPLLAQPSRPTNFCPSSSKHPSAAATRPPLQSYPPPLFYFSPLPSNPVLEASACPFNKWTLPEYRCYWKVVRPETLVGVAFGPVAAGKYGGKMTLWEGLHGGGDVYRTLLREGTTALLNSYNSFGFYYPTLIVIEHMNLALLGSQRDVLMAALRFRRANSGDVGQSPPLTCNFKPC